MAFNATLDGSTATITVTTINNMASLKVEDAANLANQLSAFVNDAAAAPVNNTPAYMVYPTDTGIMQPRKRRRRLVWNCACCAMAKTQQPATRVSQTL